MPRHPWTPAEDHQLRALVQRLGDQRGRRSNWSKISACLPGRTNKDCRKRWFHSLDPSLRKGKWTTEEDRLLLSAYARLGPAWKEIASLIPGRKDDQCSKRYNDILNPAAKSRLQQWSPDEDRYLISRVSELGNAWAAISAGLPGRPPLTCRNRWRRLSKTVVGGVSGSGAVESGSEGGFEGVFSFGEGGEMQVPPFDIRLVPTPLVEDSLDISSGESAGVRDRGDWDAHATVGGEGISASEVEIPSMHGHDNILPNSEIDDFLSHVLPSFQSGLSPAGNIAVSPPPFRIDGNEQGEGCGLPLRDHRSDDLWVDGQSVPVISEREIEGHVMRELGGGDGQHVHYHHHFHHHYYHHHYYHRQG